MSKIIAKILDQPPTVVETAVDKLEHWSGYQSTDVRLLAETAGKVRAKTAGLGLDPDDTTSRELYHALRAKLSADSDRLNKRLGFAATLDNEEYLDRFMNLVQHAELHSEVWGLKWNVARRLLRDHPPKRLMKQLNYRSVDSLLKREYIGELLAALPLVESERWLNVFWRGITDLGSGDFENRRMQVVVMSSDRWAQAGTKELCQTLPHVGVIAIWSAENVTKLGVLGLGLEFFAATERLKYQSSYLKLKQFEPGFGERLLQAVKRDLQPLLAFTSLAVDWQVACKHLGQLDATNFSNWLPPHIQHEDIHHTEAVDLLSHIDPVLNWWRDLEHVAAHKNGRVVSFNLADLYSDHLTTQDFKHRSLEHVASGFWHELVDRYLVHENVMGRILGPLDSAQPQTETVPAEDLSADDLESQIRQAVGV